MNDSTQQGGRAGLSYQFCSNTRLGVVLRKRHLATDPSVVMVTMVYQNASGMLVNLVPATFFSA